MPHYVGRDSSQTIEKCIGKCSSLNFSYAGVQYYSECWCGNVHPTNLRPSSDCNTPCSGNQNQICGGGMRLNVYHSGDE